MLPLAIRQMTRLTELNVSDNRLLVLPPAVAEMYELRELKLDHNKLRSVPPTIKVLAAERERTQCGEIERMDADFGSTTLQNLTNLTKLSLIDNLIEVLPDDVGEMMWLEELSVIGNNLKLVPWPYGKMKALEKLEVYDVASAAAAASASASLPVPDSAPVVIRWTTTPSYEFLRPPLFSRVPLP